MKIAIINENSQASKNKIIYDALNHKDLITILKEIDQKFLYQTIDREQFKKYFFENAEEGEIKEYIRKILYIK